GAARAYVPPSTPQEQQLCDLVAQVLKVERVGMTDDFFDLGGESLTATSLASRIGKTFGVTVTIRAIFEAGDIDELARTVKNASASSRPKLRRVDRSALE
ncbi:phosphopantetheine-binding protein, partial [Streptomyces aureocirculatus]|uniref:phosphopantetheine-binding protein n=1 Tax=Streptomyces aureocirculatus TaxID=67275 RepID=UPI0004C78043